MNFNKDLLDCGFRVPTTDMKNKSVRELIKMVNERHALLDSIQQEFNQEFVTAIQESNAKIMAFCTHFKIEMDQKVAIDRINNIVTHMIQEHAMKTKKQDKKVEVKTTLTKPQPKTEKQEPKQASKVQSEGRAKREPVIKKSEPKAAAPAKAEPKKAEKTPGKAPASPAPEPQKQEAAKPAAEFKTPCGGLFDADPSSTCFGMCKDESPDDFELCMGHYKAALESKTNRRRVASRGTAEKRAAGVKKAPKRYDRIGDGVGTSAHMINILLLEGATIEEMMEIVPTERTRIMGHLSGLKTGNGHRAPKTVIKDPTDKRYYLEVEEGEPCTYFTIC